MLLKNSWSSKKKEHDKKTEGKADKPKVDLKKDPQKKTRSLKSSKTNYPSTSPLIAP
ncbi:hypothetical protein HBZS_115830 [Helicobacter bizzozeronii CCUG 35545]|nr:hypothetical protein HBZS_115830 [Helicobacter bizzozeronii CCUG 35545]